MGQMKNKNALSWAGFWTYYSTYLCLYITDLGENIIARRTANYVVLCILCIWQCVKFAKLAQTKSKTRLLMLQHGN